MPVSAVQGGRKEQTKANLLLGPPATVMGPLWVWALGLQPDKLDAREVVTIHQDLGRGPFGHWTWSK